MQQPAVGTVQDASGEQLVRGFSEHLVEQLSQQLLAQLSDVLQEARDRLEHCLAAVPQPVPVLGLEEHRGPDGPNVFRCEGQFWTLEYRGRTARLRDSRGLRHLGQLLSRPNQPVHVLELAGQAVPGVLARDGGLEVLDARARADYRRRLAQLDEEALDAEQAGDVDRRERCLCEREWLVAELSRALGLGGRARTTGGSAERARTAVTKAVRSAVGTVHEHHHVLGEHLARTVRTGTVCTYVADPAPHWVC